MNAVGVTDIDLEHTKPHLAQWLADGMHGDMDYMPRHGLLRAEPATLVPGTVRVISVRVPYLPENTAEQWRDHAWQRLEHTQTPYISVYARGRDYHKVIRKQLQRLADAIEKQVGSFGYRVFCDSAPVLEVALAQKAGIGWRGKHTLLLDREGGSMFFLGEILTDLPLTPTEPVSEHCGSCTACIDVCPTKAIVKPYWLDARRCISYLTIEHKGAIPEEFRRAMGVRIYGCDDCQLICPWNKFATTSRLPDFDERAVWQDADWVELLGWTEAEFLQKTEGSAIRRIGHERWQRNVAVAIGNVLSGMRADGLDCEALATALLAALHTARAQATAMVAEHIDWAVNQAQPM